MNLWVFLKVSFHLILFLPGYLFDILRSNLRVAIDVVTPRHLMQPAFVWYPLERELTQWQILIVANLITMTPGTVALEYDPNRRAFLVHLMYRDEIEQIREEVARISSVVGGV